MNKWEKICITLLLFCSCSFSLAQSYDYKQLHFKQYDVSEGIPLVALATIYKDSYNFLWTSTYYGVSIFNGENFTNLTICPMQKIL